MFSFSVPVYIMIQLLCDDCDDFPIGHPFNVFRVKREKKMFFSNRVIFTSKLSRKSLQPTYFSCILSFFQDYFRRGWNFWYFFFLHRLLSRLTRRRKESFLFEVAMCILNDNDTYYKHTCYYHTVLGVLILWIFNIKNRLFVCQNLKCSKR